MFEMILDCDPGHDDAVALLLALGHPRSELRLVSCVAGNQDVGKTWLSARRVCGLAGSRVPVVAGASQPMSGPLITAAAIHGESGLDGPDLEGYDVAIDTRDAVDALIEVLRDAVNGVTIVATGPLTNVAQLLLRGKHLDAIERIIFMGGSTERGNWAPYSEFNMLVDPEAADVVMNSGIPTTMVGLNVTHQALVTPEVVSRFSRLGDPIGLTCVHWMTYFEEAYRTVFGFKYPPLHDVVAVAAAINPDLLTTAHYRVEVEKIGEFTRGATVVDIHDRWGAEPNVHVATGLNVAGLWETMLEGISRLPLA